MPRYISKQVFRQALECPAAGWALRHGQLEEDVDDFLVRQGEEVHELARTVFPDGRLVRGETLQETATETASLVETADIGTLFDVRTLFEPAFLVAPYVTRPDILRFGSAGWELYEVKAGTEEKAEYLDDMSYTAMVLRTWGLELASVSLMLLDEAYRLHMPVDRLFRTIDRTAEVLARADELAEDWTAIAETTAAGEPPPTELRLKCRKCPYFNQFLRPTEGHHIFELPYLSQKRFRPLKEGGIKRIEDIPADIELTDTQERVRTAVQTDDVYVGPGLAEDLAEIAWPTFNLDFETIQTALPLFPDTGPSETIVFQYSVHKCSAPGEIDAHREFLADPERDQRRELAESLLVDLEEQGSILIYTGYEKTMIEKLAEQVPELADPLLTLIDRMVDLHKLIKDHVAHPDFHGSFSIKKTLPVLVPEMSYENLEIGEGGDAMAQYAELVWGARDAEEAEEAEEAERILGNLRAYCKQDTLAMVKLHNHLTEKASDHQSACDCFPSSQGEKQSFLE